MDDRRYMSRKFILTGAVFLTASGFLVAGLISAEQWKDMAWALVGLYMVGNVGDTVAEKRGAP